MAMQNNWNIQGNLGRETKKTSHMSILHDFKTSEVTIIKTEWSCHKIHIQVKGTETAELKNRAH